MVDRKIHNWNFEPIVQIGEKVLLLTGSGQIPARVIWVEPLPYLEINFGALAAGATSDEREMEELYVEDDEFAQYRCVPVTDNIAIVEHSAPKAAKYYATKSEIFEIRDKTTIQAIEPIKRLQLHEFFQYKDEKRYMRVKNIGTSDLTEAKVAFFGYVFVFEKLPKIEKPYTAIPCVARMARRTGGGTKT